MKYLQKDAMLAVANYKMRKNVNITTAQIAYSMRTRASAIVKVVYFTEPFISHLTFSSRSQEYGSLVTSFETSHQAPRYEPRAISTEK